MDKLDKTTGNTLNSSCSLYEYWKKQPSFFIAMISSLLAIATFVVNIEMYLADYFFYKHYGIDLTTIKWNSHNQLYIAIAVVVCVIAVIFSFAFLDSSFTVFWYRHYVRRIKKNKKIPEEIITGEQNAKTDSAMKKAEKQTEKMGGNAEVTENNSNENKANNENESTVGCNNLKTLLGHIIVFVFLWSFFSYIIYLAMSSGFDILAREEGLFIVRFILSGVIFLILLVTFLSKSSGKKHAENHNIGGVVSEYPLVQFAKLKISEYLTNTKIKQLTMIGFATILLLFPLVLVSIHSTQLERRDYEIYEEDGVSYVLVYQEETTYYFDKAAISNNNSLQIYTAEQKILKTDSIVLKRTSFFHVDIIP